MIEIDRGSTAIVDHSMLIERLADAGYTRVPMVLEPGEFSVRGGIVDVFPVNQSHPLRFDYDGEVLERLNSFNIQTQRSISAVSMTAIRPVVEEQDAFYHAAVSTPAGAVIDDIYPGDYVVHETYGIGQFRGLVRLTVGQREGEYLHVQYKGEDKLYVPLEQIHLVTRYSAADTVPKVNAPRW